MTEPERLVAAGSRLGDLHRHRPRLHALVGGSRALIDELLARDRLEVLPWPVDGSLWAHADSLNR